uniref:Uncharacterized protein n=1 Tax=Aegilops tauschii subsp. strangulata TaxID=200361 RepID=A0A453KNF4_AEGTS
MEWKHTDQFRRVKKKIAKHLRFYPMIFHADITCRLERISNGTLSTCSSQGRRRSADIIYQSLKL